MQWEAQQSVEQGLRGGREGRPAPTPDQRWNRSEKQVVKWLVTKVLLGYLVADHEKDWLVVKKVEHTLQYVKQDIFTYNILIQYCCTIFSTLPATCWASQQQRVEGECSPCIGSIPMGQWVKHICSYQIPLFWSIKSWWSSSAPTYTKQSRLYDFVDEMGSSWK